MGFCMLLFIFVNNRASHQQLIMNNFGRACVSNKQIKIKVCVRVEGGQLQDYKNLRTLF